MAAGSHSLTRSPTNTRLPRDLDILVPSRPTRPTWSQCRTKGRPVTDSDWAVSHSWWGKTRSRPPPWTSRVSPSSRRARAEHSMCHPGRPGPHRDSQDGSSGRDGCHSTKSRGCRLLGSSGFPPCSAAMASMVGGIEVAERPEALEGGHVEVHRAAGLVGVAGVEHRTDEGEDLGDGRSGPGLGEGGDQAEGGHVGVEPGDLLRGQVEVVDAELAGLAEDVVVHVGDVAHAPSLVAEVPQSSLQDVEGQVDLGVAQVGRVVRRDPARVEGHHRSGLQRGDRPSGRVVELHSPSPVHPVSLPPSPAQRSP